MLSVAMFVHNYAIWSLGNTQTEQKQQGQARLDAFVWCGLQHIHPCIVFWKCLCNSGYLLWLPPTLVLCGSCYCWCTLQAVITLLRCSPGFYAIFILLYVCLMTVYKVDGTPAVVIYCEIKLVCWLICGTRFDRTNEKTDYTRNYAKSFFS